MLGLIDNDKIEITLLDCKLVIDELDSKVSIEVDDIKFHYMSENMSNIYKVTTVTDGDLRGKILSEVDGKYYLESSCFRVKELTSSDATFIGLEKMNILVNVENDELEVFLLEPFTKTIIEHIKVRRSAI